MIVWRAQIKNCIAIVIVVQGYDISLLCLISLICLSKLEEVGAWQKAIPKASVRKASTT